MQGFKQTAKKIQVLGNNITLAQPAGLLTGDTATALIEKLVYGTKLANDHILHELEARYGGAIAQYIMEQLSVLLFQQIQNATS